METSSNVKSSLIVNNWRVKKHKGTETFELSYWSPCSYKESGSVSGRTATNGHLTSPARFKNELVILVKTFKDRHGIWYGTGSDGKTYKMLYGNKYSNTKYPVQSDGEIDLLLNKLLE